MDIDYVKEMCCNLQQQQKKINETYDELMNSLNLQYQIEELVSKLEVKEEEIVNKENIIKEYENELKLKKIEIEKHKSVIEDREKEIERLRSKLKGGREELARVRRVGSMIIGTHSQQFTKLLGNMEKLLELIQYYAPNEEEMDEEKGMMDSNYDYYKEDKDVRVGDDGSSRVVDKEVVTGKEDSTDEGDKVDLSSKSSLELLVDINDKFVRVSVSIMRLLSQFDHRILTNYVNGSEFDYSFDDFTTIDNQYYQVNTSNSTNSSNMSGSSIINTTTHIATGDDISTISNSIDEKSWSGQLYDKLYDENTLNSSSHSVNKNMSPLWSSYSSMLGGTSSMGNGNNYNSSNYNMSSVSGRNSGNNSSNVVSNSINQPIISTIYPMNNGSVTRIVTRFRPKFNKAFQPIPLYKSRYNNGMIGYKNVFQPIYNSNNRNNTSYSDENSTHLMGNNNRNSNSINHNFNNSNSNNSNKYGSSSADNSGKMLLGDGISRSNFNYYFDEDGSSSINSGIIGRDKSRFHEMNRVINRDMYLNLTNIGIPKLSNHFNEYGNYFKEREGISTDYFKKDKNEESSPEIGLKYTKLKLKEQRDDLEGDDGCLRDLEMELKREKYSIDDTPMF